MSKVVERLDVNDTDFWYNLENDRHKILKWSPEGNYQKTFTPEYKYFLERLHNLPTIPNIQVGDIVEGIISSIDRRQIVIDINYKDSIFVDVKAPDLKIVQNLQKGDKINVMITSFNDNPFEIKGSITELIKMDVANKLRDFYKENIPLKVLVKEMIPAGFMLDIEMDNINITAFMPNTLAGVNKLTETQSLALVGQEIDVMLETLQQEKGVYVVSRKKYLKSLIEDRIELVKDCCRKNPEIVYHGFVTGTKDFGVFVEFQECLTGMIHKVNIQEEWQERLHEIKPGTPITFFVKDVLKGDKIILTQILRESLWDTIRVGNVREGVVRSIKPFGALISLDAETTGLIQNTYIEKSGKTLKKGDKVDVKVVSVIKDDRKIYLDFKK
jgi:small subunit ribosomal protein S1